MTELRRPSGYEAWTQVTRVRPDGALRGNALFTGAWPRPPDDVVSAQMMKRVRALVTFLAGLVLGGALVYTVLSYKHSSGPFRGDTGRLQGRSAAWAQPLASQRLHNFHRVSEQLYRGAQPDRDGVLELEQLGIRTIINLRLSSSDRKLVEGTGLVPVDIPAEPWDLEEADMVAFLRVATDATRTPVFVHCSHGADRTGAMTAIYRIVAQGWDKEEAIREMTQGGFGYHTLWDNLPTTLRKLDVPALKAKLAAQP
jgi:protein tyrosine phosphatase (PTP) superfamily phosphohydrolase (DUF442 family)